MNSLDYVHGVVVRDSLNYDLSFFKNNGRLDFSGERPENVSKDRVVDTDYGAYIFAS